MPPNKNRDPSGYAELQRLNARAMDSRVQDPANLGRRLPMNTQPNGAAFVLTQTSLLSQRIKQPQQLMITLMSIARGPNGTTPWSDTFNNTNTAPTALNSTAPVLPDGNRGLQLYLRWGSGGAAMETRFNYPVQGGTFGLTADSVDLSVLAPSGAPFTYTSLNDVPQVGAWMCPGQAANPTPLRWPEGLSIIPTGQSKYFAVKPFARQVEVSFYTLNIGAAQGSVVLTWADAGGNAVKLDSISPTPDNVGATTGNVRTIVEVPPNATNVQVQNSSTGTMTGFLTWQIGLM